MMKGVCAHPEEAVQFGFTTAVHEDATALLPLTDLNCKRESCLIAISICRCPALIIKCALLSGTHRITVDDMVNYFGPMGKVRGSGR
eukprot:2387462-Rhodomonas_salina.2